MPSGEKKLFRAGEICDICPSIYLGSLSLGQTCSGPKEIDVAGQNIRYCGREPIKTHLKPSIVQQLIRKSGMDE